MTSGSSQSFTYDARNWLSTAKGSYGKLEWSWDTNGNIYGQLLNSTTLSTFATAENSNQLASATISGTTTNLTSDADGNQTGYVTSSQKVTTQAFNEAGRLATVQYT